MDISAYGSAIQKIVPGTFVPDLAPQTPASEPLDDGGTGLAGSPTGSFRDAVKSFLTDVNEKEVAADQASQDMALGKSSDTTGAIKSVEEASLAMEYTLAVRNKLLTAYTAIEQMQV